MMILMLVALGIASCSVSDNPTPTPDPAEPKDDLADVTVLVYGNAGGQMDNLMEGLWERMKPMMKTKDVRVLFFYKYGAEKDDMGKYQFTGKYGSPGEVVFFELEDTTNLNNIQQYGVAIPEWPMYEPKSLAFALDMAAMTCPAKEYAFVLYGHGGGFDFNQDFVKEPSANAPSAHRAVLYDELNDGIGMDMYEFKKAFELATDIKHPKAIMFHNCLLGNMESLMEITSCTDYIMSSPFSLASHGEPIEYFVKSLFAKKDIPSAMADGMDAWQKALQNTTDPHEVMNGALLLTKSEEMNKITPIVAKLSERLTEQYASQRAAIDTATVHTYGFMLPQSFFDLANYAENIATYTKDAQFESISQELRQAFRQATIKQVSVTADTKRPTLSEYSLSVVLLTKKNFQSKLKHGKTPGEVYEPCLFNQQSHWGNWLNTNEQEFSIITPFGQSLFPF